MRIVSSKLPMSLLSSTVLTLLFVSTACQPASNTNSNTSNANPSPSANTNASPASTSDQAIDSREPSIYQARISLTAQTIGSGQNISLPAMTADVARNGADRRVSFVVPGGDEVIYLDRADKRYILLPKRKQYAELTQASTGFEVPQMMTPAQIVDKLKALKGYQRVGEESVNGRTAIKYKYSGTSKTGTQAGEVQTEAIVLVDKETGLPLRSEMISESESGSVKGVTGLKIITEMTDIKTNVDATVFEVPSTFAKVSDQQVRRYVDAVGQAVVAIIGKIIQSTSSAAPNASPTASSSPTSVK